MEITIKKLKIDCIIGVYEHEKNTPQEILINLKCNFDGSQAAQNDALSNTVDYDNIVKIISQICQKENYNLLEKLSQIILEEIMSSFPQITATEIEIIKPQAISAAKYVSITNSIKR